MLFQKNITLASLALWLIAVPSPSAALLKRHRVITDLTDSVIDERLFTDWRRDKQKMNRSGIDLDAIERDLEERRWLQSYSHSKDSYTIYSSIDFRTGYDSERSGESVLDSDSKSPEGCKFKGKMYDLGEWIYLENDKCKCNEGGSSKLVECEQYTVGGEGEGALPSHTSDSNVAMDEGGVTVETGASADSEEYAGETEIEIGEKLIAVNGLVGCPSAGVFTTNTIVVNFDYIVKTNPEVYAVNILATYTEIERKIFNSLASEVVKCSEESPKIIVAKAKGSGRKLEVILIDSYPDDQVVGACDGVKYCFIVQGAITVTYTENETKEYATLYTMNTIKKKMDSGEFNNQGNIISVGYLGKPGNFSELKSAGARKYDNNKSTKLLVILICSFLFLALASFLAKVLYDSNRDSKKNSDIFIEENKEFLIEEQLMISC